MSSVSSLSFSYKPSNFDEFSMHQNLLFADSLKDLRNLRTQLYSAAEYFELSYTNDDQKQVVVDTLKDYAIKALINTIDHLGSVSYKVNDILDESAENVCGLQLQVSCMDQKLKSCQKSMDSQGYSQQSLNLMAPKYHKRYLLPVGDTLNQSGRPALKHRWCSLDDEDDWHQLANAVRSSCRDIPTRETAIIRKGRSPSASARLGSTFSFTEKPGLSDKRKPSPFRAMLPLVRAGSYSGRPTTPLSSRSTTPVTAQPMTTSSTTTRHRVPKETRKTTSMRLGADRENSKDTEEVPTKSKRLLKALLSRRKSKKDDSLYTFLDEY
ncbi:hypothetical protein ACHQM5_000146 [Ranunculus cassubicifolius]